MKLNELKRPEKKHNNDPAYDFFEVEKYMEQKYDFRLRDFARRDLYYKNNPRYQELTKASFYNKKPAEWTDQEKADCAEWKIIRDNEPPYQDYWHEMCGCLTGNGSYMYWDFTGYASGEYAHKEEWKRQLCQYFVDEFGEEEASEMYFWVSW